MIDVVCLVALFTSLHLKNEPNWLSVHIQVFAICLVPFGPMPLGLVRKMWHADVMRVLIQYCHSIKILIVC